MRQGTATNNSYAFMEEHLANHRAVAGKINFCSSYCFIDTISHTDTEMYTNEPFTHMNKKKGNDALGRGL